MYALYLTVMLLSGSTDIQIGVYDDWLQCVAEAGSVTLGGIDKEMLYCAPN